VEKETLDIMQHMSDTLDEVLVVLKKPGSKFMRVLEVFGAVVSVLAILGLIDIVRNWIIGG
jgi:hypothetical protein